uniref:Uncharacterized protein n=1 Tax=Chromera velia CCMP2878 TaxID=1169474 RepID=A0A0G4H0S0_9ALVE|eukprot:Cvel_24240.t1-p1 / transcript=Cvel_24240.t1 / gene=Cvel_24240 / organism=Chromera_velia_CCMP2878 / gene_product=hypothetical protein / transcript_product=hypothetical protein / location=Cvel_scaffold2595:15146-16271(+) / protein_length=212 / sequence_SO=supercontig / SO=protein_coding / is_pseudo=false
MNHQQLFQKDAPAVPFAAEPPFKQSTSSDTQGIPITPLDSKTNAAGSCSDILMHYANGSVLSTDDEPEKRIEGSKEAAPDIQPSLVPEQQSFDPTAMPAVMVEAGGEGGEISVVSADAPLPTPRSVDRTEDMRDFVKHLNEKLQHLNDQISSRLVEAVQLKTDFLLLRDLELEDCLLSIADEFQQHMEGDAESAFEQVEDIMAGMQEPVVVL